MYYPPIDQSLPEKTVETPDHLCLWAHRSTRHYRLTLSNHSWAGNNIIADRRVDVDHYTGVRSFVCAGELYGLRAEGASARDGELICEMSVKFYAIGM
jgi:hypothetical protein